MLRTVLWFTYFWLYKLYSLLLLKKVNRLINSGQHQQAEKEIAAIARSWARSIIKYTGTKVEVAGLENIPEGTVLFVSNHQSNFDIPLLIGYIDKPKGFIAKAELKKVPIIRTWMEKIHCVFIERDNMRQSVKAILEGIELLKQGKSMVLFPEGTRSKSNVMNEFKAGGMKLALKAKVPIVPVTIKGSYQMLEQKRLIKPAKVKLVVSPPIYVDKLSKEEQAKLSETVRDIIAKELN
ncbi:lysophospholipid acyltransferase family protein [Desulfofalx alkaliphila]|uniref:lysophospholipid acyltransferase family protein n=1 Tax=Desulfofalx alkaliphila TaxID=105483 RepID=UPI0004E1E5EA|nr:lysophospholipid acyltransferase family protein [Desulfofalx alkaliphila]